MNKLQNISINLKKHLPTRSIFLNWNYKLHLIYVWTIVVLEKLTNVSKVHLWDLNNFFRLGKRYYFYFVKRKRLNGKHHRHAYRHWRQALMPKPVLFWAKKLNVCPWSPKKISKVWLQDLKTKCFRPLSVIMTKWLYRRVELCQLMLAWFSRKRDTKTVLLSVECDIYRGFRNRKFCLCS